MRRTSYFLLVTIAVAIGVTRWVGNEALPEGPSAAAAGAEFVNVSGSMEFYRERLMREPDVVGNYVGLAQLHLQEARSTGREADHWPQAQRLIEEALDRDPENIHALALRGSLLNSMHRFEDAREVAENLIERVAAGSYAHGILVDALVELGRYEEAVRACDRMVALRPELASYARASYLRELHGDAGGAMEAMRLAADAGVAGREDRAWALYNLGMMYLGAGKSDTAAHVFNGILEERPAYAHAVAGLGRVDAVRGLHTEAIMRYRFAYEEQPRPEFLEWMMDSYTELGDRQEAATLRNRLLRSLESAASMGENVDMETADFLAEHDIDRQEALRLARKEMQRRPDHMHVLETYAWALFRNGRAREAIPHIERAMRLGAEDGMLRFRAARIYDAHFHMFLSISVLSDRN